MIRPDWQAVAVVRQFAGAAALFASVLESLSLAFATGLKTKATERLGDLGEDEIVRRLISMLPLDHSVVVGPGDDCAVLEYGRLGYYQLYKTDCLVQGVHYLPETPPHLVGRKALARAISDIAAMGGWPTQALVTTVLPLSLPFEWVEQVYQGLSGVAREFGVSIVGGETARPAASSPKATVISVCLLGLVEKDRCILRSRGQPGDHIFVTGHLGGSISGRHLQFQPRVWEGRWLSENFRPSAMMDLSDGIARDLPRLTKLSGTGFQIVFSKVPCAPGSTTAEALNDGEDYELLFTIAPNQAEGLKRAWRRTFPTLELTEIGWLCPPEESMEGELAEGGWDHFAEPSA